VIAFQILAKIGVSNITVGIPLVRLGSKTKAIPTRAA
jgi:hypothetical protein